MNLVELKTQYSTLIDEASLLVAEMQSDEAKNTAENLTIVQQKTTDAKKLAEKIKTFETVGNLKTTITDGGGRKTEIFQPAQVLDRSELKTIGEQFTESEAYKKLTEKKSVPSGLRLEFESKGTIRQLQTKATFGSGSTGLDSTVNYVPGVVLLEQQRLTVRDLLSVGETTQAAVKWIKEDSYTNGADTVSEEGEKPEASFDTGTDSADVKKIAVVAKVTDEMWSDFPMLRDYLNTRLRFMVESKEEYQLLNGSGSGNQLKGILNAGIQNQPRGSDTNLDAIHKAITKVRVATGTTGGFEPDAIVIHPTDYQSVRLAKDTANQYYGGGPFTGAYGNSGLMQMPSIWGLKTVVTTAIAQGTCLVGAFKLGAQIWQRDGIRVDATNTNEDDFNFNRVSLRVEERLALAIYRASAFCTVTSLN